MDFLAERDRLLAGDAAGSGTVMVSAFAWPPPATRLGFIGAVVGWVLRRTRRPDTVAIYPEGSTKGAYPFGIVPLEVPPGAPLPTEGRPVDWYGRMEEGHAVAFDIEGELYVPSGPFAPAPMWAPRLR